MDAERWRRVRELFDQAVRMEPDSASAFLSRACSDDELLRAQVADLLTAHRNAATFIEAPLVEDALRLIGRVEGRLAPGARIDRYVIEREIGRGGMGVVYLASREDPQFQQRVAIKVIKRGLDTDEVLRRFLSERQILASLNHPNIARLLDGGTTADGLPYFVMEYVEGLPLLEYADAKRLSIDDRLTLFLKVCAAVQHAHQNLVVHRDLKPGNVLIAGDGEPKLLDFGIAKLLSPDTTADLTLTMMRVLTPEYASPEQVVGEAITTASDVYSLGVIFCQLLTGRHPYRAERRAPSQIGMTIAETPTERPSEIVDRVDAPGGAGTSVATAGDIAAARNTSADRLKRALRGDLDNIVLKALRKEPVRRYASVAEFAADIRRYLDGLPVAARPDTFRYRAGKFVSRHRVAVSAAALVLLSLVGGIVATTWEARAARRQQVRAERRFNDVRRLANSLLFEIDASVQDLAGATPTRRLLVTRALEYLDGLADESRDDPTLRRELATAYERVGDIQGNPYNANVGDIDGALASYDKALTIRHQLGAAGSEVDAQRELAITHRSIADVLEQKGDFGACVANYRESLAILEALARRAPNEFAVRDELGRAYEALGDGLGRTGDRHEQLQRYRQALEVRQTLLASNPTNTRLRRSVAITLMKIGEGYVDNRDDGIASFRQAIAIMEALSAADPTNARFRRDVSMVQNRLGEVLNEIGEPGEAEPVLRSAFAIREALASEDTRNMQARFDLAAVRANLSESLSRSGHAADAQTFGEASLAALEELSSRDAANMVYLRNLGLAESILGLAHATAGADRTLPAAVRARHWTSARALYRKSLDVFMQLQHRGALRPADGNMAGRLNASIAECDRALAALGRGYVAAAN